MARAVVLTYTSNVLLDSHVDRINNLIKSGTTALAYSYAIRVPQPAMSTRLTQKAQFPPELSTIHFYLSTAINLQWTSMRSAKEITHSIVFAIECDVSIPPRDEVHCKFTADFTVFLL